MTKIIEQNSKNITLSKEDYLKLLETYQKLGEILISKKRKNRLFFKELVWYLEGSKS